MDQDRVAVVAVLIMIAVGFELEYFVVVAVNFRPIFYFVVEVIHEVAVDDDVVFRFVWNLG